MSFKTNARYLENDNIWGKNYYHVCEIRYESFGISIYRNDCFLNSNTKIIARLHLLVAKKNKRKGQDIRESTRIICSQYINRINQQWTHLIWKCRDQWRKIQLKRDTPMNQNIVFTYMIEYFYSIEFHYSSLKSSKPIWSELWDTNKLEFTGYVRMH